jgi:hypothetical protein
MTVAHGADRFHVMPFEEAEGEALLLFKRVIGEELVAKEQAVFNEIAKLLGYLPLAVDIAACRLAYEPEWSGTDFLRQLRNEKDRLNHLVYEERGVRSAFETSYALLSPVLQRFFAALGAFGGEDISGEAAAAVVDLSLKEAEANLRELFSLSLVRRGRPGRYRLIPLLRTFAREKIAAEGTWENMVSYFVGYAERHEGDLSALDLERNNILVALEVARERGMVQSLDRGVKTFSYFLEQRGLFKLDRVRLLMT